MNIGLVQADFKGVGDIATHCDKKKLHIAINEAIQFDLEPILCNAFGSIDVNWRTNESPYKELIHGSTFQNCKGFDTYHVGLKKILVYYSYARYVFNGPFNDTASGQVMKTDTYSIPKPFAETKQYSNKYKQMALAAFEKVESFAYLNINDYPGFPVNNIKGCGCNGSCGSTHKTKGFGLRSKNVSKY